MTAHQAETDEPRAQLGSRRQPPARATELTPVDDLVVGQAPGGPAARAPRRRRGAVSGRSMVRRRTPGAGEWGSGRRRPATMLDRARAAASASRSGTRTVYWCQTWAAPWVTVGRRHAPHVAGTARRLRCRSRFQPASVRSCTRPIAAVQVGHPVVEPDDLVLVPPLHALVAQQPDVAGHGSGRSRRPCHPRRCHVLRRDRS